MGGVKGQQSITLNLEGSLTESLGIRRASNMSRGNQLLSQLPSPNLLEGLLENQKIRWDRRGRIYSIP